MAWDPYDLPNTSPQRPDHRLPEEPVKGRAVAGVLVCIILLAIAFTIAANAQEMRPTGSESQVQQAQQRAQGQLEEQLGTTSSMQAQPEEQAAEAKPLEGQIVKQPEGSYVASDLIGRPVMSAEGEQMGKIADLLVSDDNRVAGVIVGIGGFLGFGEKRIAVPFDRIQRTATQESGEQLALDFSRAELENAPAFVSLAKQRSQQQPASEGQALTQ